jgi:hypothetical protein
MQLGGSGATSGRQGQWFCIAIKHRATHRLLCSNSSPEKNIPVITQPPHSPDLAPSVFWLFPILKVCLKGTRFTNKEDIKSNATAELRNITKEAFAGASNNGRVDETIACVRACSLSREDLSLKDY